MKKLALITALILAFGVSLRADVLTGNVQITSGEAFASESSDSIGFDLQGQNFSVTDYTLGDPPQIIRSGGFPTQTENFSCIGPAGEYMGIQADCFGPFGLPSVQGWPAAYSAGEGFRFVTSGATTVSADGGSITTSQFTASGELIGFSPYGCANQNPIDCTELWDVTFTGRGTMRIGSNVGGFPESLELTFQPPAPTPEPSTGLLYLGGVLAGAVLWLCNKPRPIAKAG